MHSKGNKHYRNNFQKKSKYTKGEKQVCTQYLLLREEEKNNLSIREKISCNHQGKSKPYLKNQITLFSGH